MNRLTKIGLLALMGISAFATTSVARADVSYNVGYASEYYYRGIKQKNSSVPLH